MISRNIQGHILIMCIVLSAMLVGAYSTEFPANSVAITSPGNGAEVAAGIVRISGRYTGAYQITICLNGGDISDCHMDDPNGADAGTWYYDLDASKYDGAVEVTVRGLSSADRYPVMSPSIKIHVNNSAANIPTVTILNPVEGPSMSGIVTVIVAASARNPISNVQVRINACLKETVGKTGFR